MTALLPTRSGVQEAQALDFARYVRVLRPAIAPLLILFVAALAAAFGSMPASLSGLKLYGPHGLLIAGIGLSVWFNRGRPFVAFCSLFAGYAGYRLAIDLAPGGFAVRAAFTALAVLAPLNIVAALILPERGVFHHYNYRWLLAGIAEVVLVVWIASAGQSMLSGMAWQALLDHWLLSSPPTPLAGRLLIVAALAAAAYRGWTQRSPVEVGLAGSLVATLCALEWARAPGALAAFLSAAGLMLLFALLQESHRLAFRDPLTGLPGRRAFDERISGLGPVHSIAMVDVDHFKRFNDTHGHAVGDQVLKLVAARLSDIGGGGTAYRYGGEEFAVVFAGRRIGEVMPHLMRMRSTIEGYRMALRGADRPKDSGEGSLRRGKRAADETLSVTVSIGVAERNAEFANAAEVVRAADKALYRAKRAGRNRVSN